MVDDPRHQAITLRLGHSPDPDDAFMWWPLLELNGRSARIDTGRFRFIAVAEDIEALNQRAAGANAADALEITAMSCAQYPQVKHRYAITACGASMGDGYGPKLIAQPGVTLDDLRNGTICVAIPGTRTTAFAAMRMMLAPTVAPYEVVPFKQIIERVASGEFAAGLVIHEGQLTFASAGLELLADLGAWWRRVTALPLPLGVNAIRLDLDDDHGGGTLEEVTRLLCASVEHAMAHREESIEYAMNFAGDMARDLAGRFIDLYVNRWTLEFGAEGRSAVQRFLSQAHAASVVSDPGAVRFIQPASASRNASFDRVQRV